MPKQTATDDADLQERLYATQHNVAVVNASVATAVQQAAPLTDTNIPQGALDNTHGALVDVYSDLTTALDRLEVTLDGFDDDYHRATPRQIKGDHADRIEETYDGPVLFLAMELLEANRRKWLHDKRETMGAEEVERHGLTGNQRKWLNELQDAWRAYDGE